MASALLFTYGLVALFLTINALRRVQRPTSPFKPLWLPAMITGSLPGVFGVSRLVIGGSLVLLGGTSLSMGRLGLIMLSLSLVGLLVIVIRNRRAAAELSSRINTPVFDESWPTLLTGRPIPTPADIEETSISGPWGEFDSIRSASPTTARSPVFVYVHGGGWTGGGPQNQARRMYHMLAREGWIVAAVRYPFAPAASIADQVTAINQVIGELTSNPDSYGVDPDRLVISGSSAGAHLASMVALTTTSAMACLPMYGIYDMVNRNGTRPPWPYIDRDVMKGSYAERPEAFHAASPLDLVHSAAPPFLVVHGTHDSLVPIPEAEIFVTALQAAGVPVEFIRVLGAQHGFDAVSSHVSRTVGAMVTTWATDVIANVESRRDA